MFELIKITSDPIVPDIISSKLKRNDCGAVVTFIGTVRNTSNEGKTVTHLEIKLADNNAEAKLHQIASEINSKWHIRLEDIAIHRRIGRLTVGEIALVVAVAAAHRQEAFAACEYVVDQIKQGKITVEKDITA